MLMPIIHYLEIKCIQFKFVLTVTCREKKSRTKEIEGQSYNVKSQRWESRKLKHCLNNIAVQRNMRSFLIIKDNDHASNWRFTSMNRSEHRCRCERNQCRAIVGDKFLSGQSWFIPTLDLWSRMSRVVHRNKRRGIELRVMFILYSRSN